MVDLKPSQVAAELQISLRKVQEMAKSGELSAFRCGGQWRFTEADIQEYRNKNRNRRCQTTYTKESPAARGMLDFSPMENYSGEALRQAIYGKRGSDSRHTSRR